MFTINEYAACLLVVVTGATFVFMACVMVLVITEGVGIVARATLHKPNATPLGPMGHGSPRQEIRVHGIPE
jgi:Na+-transporting methylmalonyl-CoA/oxaloacetate decarboxylase gamma subunit